MTAPAQTLVQGAPEARPGRRRNLNFLGLAPFFIFAALFLLIPVVFLVVGSLQDAQGNPTLANYGDLSQNFIIDAYVTSIRVSLLTAIAGGLFGFLLAYAVILGGLPSFLRPALMTFSGVASNFAGVPLALAFIFTLGHVGLVTKFLLDSFGIDIYGGGFNLYSEVGLDVVYMYFQFPLMVLIMAPAIDGLRQDWREASANLGATPAEYWRHIALPILTPTLLGTMILLFGNSFGAQATAYVLTAGQVNLVTLVISAQMSGDVLHNVGLGYSLAVGMIAIMAVAIFFYTLLQRRSERWLR
ncbi:MAG TPA: ABC transporter permease subunit [Candidatus Limnocylindrales bacterium]|jgi:putative spermidine/putrescine transport system permease protein